MISANHFIVVFIIMNLQKLCFTFSCYIYKFHYGFSLKFIKQYSLFWFNTLCNKIKMILFLRIFMYHGEST